ncbi:hypothetical protein DICVIV_02107 [Dictyocaulus viviparus]|uniref:Uncharacterized protein n=1 Tax=Dictyocaulus viviparus TaxID=29172 RepID=A0A0D8YAW6_DICVI|nr:hypothetical protein DICVIV_02107 [Dictyocaulus viviparus]
MLSNNEPLQMTGALWDCTDRCKESSERLVVRVAADRAVRIKQFFCGLTKLENPLPKGTALSFEADELCKSPMAWQKVVLQSGNADIPGICGNVSLDQRHCGKGDVIVFADFAALLQNETVPFAMRVHPDSFKIRGQELQ